MVLSFHNKELRTLCEDEDEATIKYGAPAAEVLRKRLADLTSAKTVDELPRVGNLREVQAKETSFYEVDLQDGYILMFGVGNPIVPLNDDGTVNWLKVTRIKILKIELHVRN